MNTDNAHFERENRYIVVKLKRLQKGAREPLLRYLEHMNVNPVECVVVEADWPEYETVCRMIEARCGGRKNGMPAPVALDTNRPLRKVRDESLMSDAIKAILDALTERGLKIVETER